MVLLGLIIVMLITSGCLFIAGFRSKNDTLVFIAYCLALLSIIPIIHGLKREVTQHIGTGVAIVEIDRVETNAKGDTLNIEYKLTYK